MGKVIIYAPGYAELKLSKLKIFDENKNELLCLTQGEVGEIDVSRNMNIFGKVSLNPAGKAVLVRADRYMKIRVTLDIWGKPDLKVVSSEDIQAVALEEDRPVYDIKGARGRYLKVYEDKCIIGTKAGVASFLTGNGSDGEKTIYYSDVLGVQFKRSGLQLGYLQLETSSGMMNNRGDNFFNENSFTFDGDLDIRMEEVSTYVKKRVDEAKRSKGAPIVTQTVAVSSADELKKFKELLDAGIITQDEFDAKKKQLLGL